MRCGRGSAGAGEQYEDQGEEQGELQHLVLGGQGGQVLYCTVLHCTALYCVLQHLVLGGQGGHQCLVWACRACKRMRRVMDRRAMATVRERKRLGKVDSVNSDI